MIVHGIEADAVLFDCDGVLVDSEPASYEAWRRTLGRHGVDLTPAMFAESVGTTDLDVGMQYADAAGVDGVRLELEARDLFRRAATGVRAFADTVELLDRCREAGTAVAVATNGARWRLDVLLDAIGEPALIPLSVTSDEVERPKPAPDLYLRAAELAETAPERCVVVEDSPTGIAAAVAAGCRVVAIDRGMFSRDRLVGADRIVDRVGVADGP